MIAKQAGWGLLFAGRKGSGWEGAREGLGRCRSPLSPLGFQEYAIWACSSISCTSHMCAKMHMRDFKKKQDNGTSLQSLLRGRKQKEHKGAGEALRLLWDKGQRKELWRRSRQEGTQKMPNHSADCSPREIVMQDPLLPLPQNLWEGWLCFLLQWGRSGRIREGLAQKEDGSCIGGPRAGGEGPMLTELNSVCAF